MKQYKINKNGKEYHIFAKDEVSAVKKLRDAEFEVGKTYTTKNGNEFTVTAIKEESNGYGKPETYVYYDFTNKTSGNYGSSKSTISFLRNKAKAKVKDYSAIQDESTYKLAFHNDKWYYEITNDDGSTKLVGPYSSAQEARVWFAKHRPNDKLQDKSVFSPETMSSVQEGIEDNFASMRTRMSKMYDFDVKDAQKYYFIWTTERNHAQKYFNDAKKLCASGVDVTLSNTEKFIYFTSSDKSALEKTLKNVREFDFSSTTTDIKVLDKDIFAIKDSKYEFDGTQFDIDELKEDATRYGLDVLWAGYGKTYFVKGRKEDIVKLLQEYNLATEIRNIKDSAIKDASLEKEEKDIVELYKQYMYGVSRKNDYKLLKVRINNDERLSPKSVRGLMRELDNIAHFKHFKHLDDATAVYSNVNTSSDDTYNHLLKEYIINKPFKKDFVRNVVKHEYKYSDITGLTREQYDKLMQAIDKSTTLKDSAIKDKIINAEARTPEDLKKIIQSWNDRDDGIRVKVWLTKNTYSDIYYYHDVNGYYVIPTGIASTTTEYTHDRAKETALKYASKIFDSKSVKDADNDYAIYTLQSDVDKNLTFYIGKKYALKDGMFTLIEYSLEKLNKSPQQLKNELLRNGWHEISNRPISLSYHEKDQTLSLRNKDSAIKDASIIRRKHRGDIEYTLDSEGWVRGYKNGKPVKEAEFNVLSNHPSNKNSGFVRYNTIQEFLSNTKLFDSAIDKPKIPAQGKWEWDEVKQDWFDTGRKMYYTEIVRNSGERLNKYPMLDSNYNDILIGKTVETILGSGKIVGYFEKNGKTIFRVQLSPKEFIETYKIKFKDVNPNEEESKEDFIARFMSETKEEYPDEKQRYAVANSYWERRNLKDENIKGFPKKINRDGYIFYLDEKTVNYPFDGVAEYRGQGGRIVVNIREATAQAIKDTNPLEEVRRDIEKAKQRLNGKPVRENFGQDEVRKLKEKYFQYQYGQYSEVFDLIDEFDNWCSNYTD